jgi:hypothetical protein
VVSGHSGPVCRSVFLDERHLMCSQIVGNCRVFELVLIDFRVLIPRVVDLLCEVRSKGNIYRKSNEMQH